MKKLAKAIRRIGLIANPEKGRCRTLVRQAAQLIEQSGRQVLLDQESARFARLDLPTRDHAATLSRDVDLIMVFGGDGTMLRVARDISQSATPLVGINAGGLGFLTDVQAHQLPLALTQIWAGQTVLENRALIEADGVAAGQRFHRLALNEFVISRGAAPRLVELEVQVDDVILTRYRCDGLIVCTPTGSTAYSLAAGGAVVSPTADVFTITPICPHTLSNRSVIVGMQSHIEVQVLSRTVETQLSGDGQPPLRLEAGDVVHIRRSKRVLRLLHLAGSSFFDTLRRKLHWSGSHVRSPANGSNPKRIS